MTTPDRTVHPPPAGTPGSRAAGAARWTGVSAAATTALQLIQLAILGRLLEPRAFGLMALVLIVLNFAQLFGQMGLSEALIQRKDPTREELSSLYWLNVASSVVVFLVLWAASPMIAWGLGMPELGRILPVAALSFLVMPFGFQFRALAQKMLRFRLIAGVEIASAVVALAVAVPSAWLLEGGVWSLVWGYLCGTAAGSAILIVCGWRAGSTRPRFHFRWADLTGYLSFGLYRTGAMSVNFLNLRVAQLFVGLLLGAQALGYYSVAANLVLQPIQRLNPVLTRVAFPVFSEVQNDVARLKRGYLRVVRLLMLLNAPALLGMAAVAPTAVPLLLGERWVAAIPLVQVLAFYALLRSLGSVSGSLLMARGRADWAFAWNVGVLLVTPPTVYLASLSGNVVYIALSLVSVQTLLSAAYYRTFSRKLIGLRFTLYVRAAGIPVLLASVMGLTVLGTGSALESSTDAVRLGVQVLVGALSYSALVWLFQREELRGLIQLLSPRR